MTTEVSVMRLLGLSVRTQGIVLGVLADALLEPSLRRVLGFEVVGRDGLRRFAPWGACDVGPAEIGIDSAHSLLGRLERDYYRSHATSFGELRRTAVSDGGELIGRIDDLLVDTDGKVHRLVIQGPAARLELPPERFEASAQAVRLASTADQLEDRVLDPGARR